MTSSSRRLAALFCALVPAAVVLACVVSPDPDAGDAGVAADIATMSDAATNPDAAANDARSLDARPPGPLGSHCARNSDCVSNVCLSNGICTAACSSSDECVAGWTCNATGSESSGVCQCAPTRDTCNGRDDDCDGVVDNGAMCDGPQVCQGGACVCPPQDLCGGTCIDTLTDSNNCGACGNVCPSGMGCAGGGCVCADGVMVSCNGTCTDLRSDANNCGACGHACGTGTTCYLGNCMPRLIAPMSTTTVTSQRPVLRWFPAASRVAGGAAGAHIEICADRNCQMIEQQLDVAGGSAQPSVALAPGPHWWRATGPGERAPGSTWQFRVGTRSADHDASWAVGADVNADGYGDALVGAADGDAAWLYLGDTTTSNHRGLGFAIGLGLPLMNGSTAVAMAGDLNGDGFGDLTYAWSGEAIVHYGAHSTASLFGDRIVSPQMDDTFGASVASAGDFNGDGFADMVFGEPGTHRVYVYFGASTGFVATPLEIVGTVGIGYGQWVGAAGDLNGDGLGDFAVGAPGANTVFVYFGRADGTASSVATLVGPLGSTQFGAAVAGVGDVDGDGYSDLIAGAPGANVAVLYRGRASGIETAGTMLSVPAGAMGFGAAVAAAGDVNADGFGDVIVGAPMSNTAYVYLGGASGLAAMPITLTGEASSAFGTAVGTIGDADADGFADVIVGSPGNNRAVYYFGSATGPDPAGTIVPGAYNTFGNSIACRAPARATAAGAS